MVGDDQSSIAMASRDRDRELLIPVADDASSKASLSSVASSHHFVQRFLLLIMRRALFFEWVSVETSV
uniref:Uncharacterized protein n=1 Tax=Nelumbo nucifera TaxID=4432 RepID=A0A822ZLX5_NELNU|nr:TPA_asm: hypothetical protein HUJ06_004432 [Nelumbo nucifera]